MTLMPEYICPNCKNSIYDEDALLCHFCGESLQRAGQGFLSRIRYSHKRVVWYFVVFLVLCGFVFWIVL